MSFHSFGLRSNTKIQCIDITDKIADIVALSTVAEGICTVFVPHTTAGVMINEHADPSVVRDFLKEMNTVIPLSDSYSHLEGNSAAHIKSILAGSSVVMPITGKALSLGTWQGIFFCEFDGPRNRKVNVQISNDEAR